MTEREGTNEPGGADEVAAAHDALLAGTHSLSGLSESESLHLQRAIDRRGKSHAAAANVLKEQSDAARQITDDLE
jgi:hypothetical protein